MDTVVLPANRIERATRVMALRYRVASIVMLVTAVALLVVGVMSQFVATPIGPMREGVSDSITMFVLLVVVPVTFGLLLRRRQKRMTWIGAQATADPTILWVVDEYRIRARDEYGGPKPELEFKVTAQLREELTAVASAELR
jgi:hypothetical protein